MRCFGRSPNSIPAGGRCSFSAFIWLCLRSFAAYTLSVSSLEATSSASDFPVKTLNPRKLTLSLQFDRVRFYGFTSVALVEFICRRCVSGSFIHGTCSRSCVDGRMVGLPSTWGINEEVFGGHFVLLLQNTVELQSSVPLRLALLTI